MSDRYADLRAKAQAATPGEWRHKGKDGKFLPCGDWYVSNDESASFSWLPVKAGRRVIALLPEEDQGQIEHDAAYIAAAHPAAILALLDERERLLAAHAENARLLPLVIHDLVGRVEGGKLAALQQCADRAAIAAATGEAP